MAINVGTDVLASTYGPQGIHIDHGKLQMQTGIALHLQAQRGRINLCNGSVNCRGRGWR